VFREIVFDASPADFAVAHTVCSEQAQEPGACKKQRLAHCRLRLHEPPRPLAAGIVGRRTFVAKP
jgi:hypothetical protein